MIWRKEYSQLEISFFFMRRKDLQRWKKHEIRFVCMWKRGFFSLIDSQQKKTNMKDAMDEQI